MVSGGRRHGLKRHILTAPPRVYRGTSAPWWIPYEVITIVLMMVAAALLFYYTCYLQPQTAPTERRCGECPCAYGCMHLCMELVQAMSLHAALD
eukprot:1161715-Pelagomonas_calceolata.AAC.5